MRHFFIGFVALLCSSLLANIAAAGEINVDQRLLAMLQKDHPINQPLFGSMRWVVSDIRLVPRAIEYSQVKSSAIPDHVYRAEYLQKNCTNDVLPGVNETLNISYQHGASVTVTDALQSSQSLQLTIANTQIGVSQQVSVNTAKAENFQKGEVESQTISVPLPARTARRFILEKRISTGYLLFAGTVVVDARIGQALDGAGGDPFPSGHFSDLYSEAERTYRVAGEVWNATGQTKEFTYSDSPLDPTNPVQCPPARANTGLANVTGQPLFYASRSYADRASQIVDALLGTATIVTADVIANIEVRAKSHGPGFCATSVSGGTGSVGILAPPLAWSDWLTIDSHIGSVRKTYTASVVCATGALFQIRYWKSSP